MDAPQQAEHRAIMRSISGLLLAVFIGTLSTNILATALPRILNSLQMDVSTYTWVVTAYVLVLTVSVPLWGKLADIWDKKRLLQCVVALYIVSSFVAGCATSPAMLIVGRSLQGLGTGGLAALGQVILAAIIVPRARGRYNGYVGAAIAGGTVAGPLIGGLLVNTPLLGWRACFFATIPFGILATFLIERRLAPTPRLKRVVRLDWRGAILLVLATSMLIVWVSLLGVRVSLISWTTPAVLLVVALLSWCFIAVENRAREPVIRIGLLRSRPVFLTSAASFGSGVVVFALPLFLAQYFQLGRGFSPAVAGLAALPMILGIFTASWVVGRLVTATGRMKVFLIFGAVAQLVGLAALTQTVGLGGMVLLSLSTYVVGLGVGTLQQNLVLYVQNVINPEEMGSGTGVVQFTRFLGGAVGLSVGGVLASSLVVSHVTQAFADRGLAGLEDLSTKIPELSLAPEAVRMAYEWGYTQAVGDLFLIIVPLTFISLVAVTLLREIHLSHSFPRPPELDLELD